eukprot:scaffold131966_cov39-Phaeocystis_antarctica.AAC.1
MGLGLGPRLGPRLGSGIGSGLEQHWAAHRRRLGSLQLSLRSGAAVTRVEQLQVACPRRGSNV